MSNATTVLLATGPAAITGLTAGVAGYLTARLGSESSIRQADVQIEQLNLQNCESNRRERQAAYHQLLNHLRLGNEMLVSLVLVGQLDYEKSGPWSATFDDLANAVALYGTELVRQRVDELSTFINSLQLNRPDQPDALTARQKLSAYDTRRRSLVDAMREDVAPPAVASRGAAGPPQPRGRFRRARNT